MRRRWSSDASHLTSWIQSQIRRRLDANWTLIFPEGTRYTDRNKERSDLSCAKDGLEPMAGEILRPRTKGLALLLRESAKGGGYYRKIVDMTIQYTDADGKPLKGAALGTRCFGQLAKGQLPGGDVSRALRRLLREGRPGGRGRGRGGGVGVEAVEEKADMLEACASAGRFEGVREWSTSGAAVPLKTQTALRCFFVLQGLVCVGAACSSTAFLAYVACAAVGLAVIAQTDPAWW